MRCLALCLLFLLPMLSDGQNLVPNPSFEEYTECPYSTGQIWIADGWMNVKGSVDYFNVCGEPPYNVPNNFNGYQESFHGLANGGFGFWGNFGVTNFREFVGIELTNPLMEGAKYDVSVRLSLADTVQYAVRNFGFCFTESQPPNNTNQILALEPQVVYSGETFLDDTAGWMSVGGSFVATGVEQFLTLGNFDGDTQTDTLRMREDGYPVAYYYIDSVSVVEDTNYVGITEHLGSAQGMLELYPNPASTHITVNSKETLQQVRVLDVRGRMVLEQTLKQVQGDVRLNTNDLPSGIYMLEAITQNGARAVRKFVVEQ